MIKGDGLYIKKHPEQDLWIVNVNRVKIGTIRKRGKHYWLHMPSMNVGGKHYAEINYYPVDLPSAYAIAANTWRNERADLKFDIIREGIQFERPQKNRTPRPKIRRVTYGDFTRTTKGRPK